MSPSFQTVTNKKPWYAKPGTIFVLVMFAFLGGTSWFLFKGSEATLLARVKANDATSTICAYAIGFRGLREDATRDAFEQILASGVSEKPAPDEIRRACAYALGMSKQKHAALFLVDALQKDPSVPVRCASARALGRTQEPVGAEALLAAVSDREGDVRVAAAEGCLFFGDKRAIDKLIDQIEDPLPEVRRACHNSLVGLTGTSFEGVDEKREWRKWRETH